jgi:hypothetical protein
MDCCGEDKINKSKNVKDNRECCNKTKKISLLNWIMILIIIGLIIFGFIL